MTETRNSASNGSVTRRRRAALARPAAERLGKPSLVERGNSLPNGAMQFAATGALEDPERPSKDDIYEMIQRDATIQALKEALIKPLLLSKGHLEPAEDDRGEHEFVERCLTAPENDGGMSTPMGLVLHQQATAMFYRQAFFEKVWTRDEDGRFRYAKLAFREPRSCRIRHDMQNGSFNGFMQEGIRPNGAWFTEEFDPLYAYVFVHGHAERPLLGTSVFQSAWHEHDHKYKLRWLQARGFAKFGTGILISETDRMDDAEQEELTDAIDGVMDGGALVVGTGERPELVTPSNLPNFLDTLQYLETNIARSVLLQQMMLGSGERGSWALSKDHSDFFILSEEAVLNQIADNYNSYLIPPLVDLNFPGSSSYPKWVFPGLSDEGHALAKEVFMALLGRPQASTHPVIKAATEKTIAERLGADPDTIPDWDSPEREELPPDATAEGQPPEFANDPQRAKEADALQKAISSLKSEPRNPDGTRPG